MSVRNFSASAFAPLTAAAMAWSRASAASRSCWATRIGLAAVDRRQPVVVEMRVVVVRLGPLLRRHRLVQLGLELGHLDRGDQIARLHPVAEIDVDRPQVARRPPRTSPPPDRAGTPPGPSAPETDRAARWPPPPRPAAAPPPPPPSGSPPRPEPPVKIASTSVTASYADFRNFMISFPPPTAASPEKCSPSPPRSPTPPPRRAHPRSP